MQPHASKTPSQAEMGTREITDCATYRSWRPRCIAARDRGTAHKTGEEPSEIPEVGIYYGYQCKGDGNTIPLLCARERNQKSHACAAVPAKGRDRYAIAYLNAFLKRLGNKKIVIRSDNEMSLISLIEASSELLKGVGVVHRTSPEGDHQSNGLAELGVRECKGQCIAVRSLVESKLRKR